ncbi:MAG: peptide chain release factor N(5)-glutamine methyltransferase, partial [Rickettsiales bacterium]|nr:peptide chain release factor N(5)-glutamine methyltransferase [Rickettsiales bacterium]
MVLCNLIDKCRVLLGSGGIETFPLDCKILVSEVLGVKVKDLILHLTDDVDDDKIEQLQKLMKRRLNFEPVSKIINKRSFWEYDFYVDENVLDPRPDSEVLIESIVKDYGEDEGLKILDLGTGGGCLILTLLKLFKNAYGVAVDISEKSLEVARRNAKDLEVDNIKFLKGNWNDGLDEKFDIIVSNPPYIRTSDIQNLQAEVKIFDPTVALDGGDDGLSCYRYIASNVKKNCSTGTKIYLEIGLGQENDVIKVFENKDFRLE